MSDNGLDTLVALLGSHEARSNRSINFTPSENVLSPLARVPFVTDAYSRYFFDHFRVSFVGGLDIGRIQMDILEPLLREMTEAEFVEVRPLSGMNCAAIALAALCPQGGTVLTIPVGGGGHSSTASVASRLGIRVLDVPMADVHFVDVEKLGDILARESPDLVYLDQSSLLFPIDPRPIRQLIDRHSPGTILHMDSSHTNGLILGGALPNPLKRGAHTFGGSTHKTLPGPHKGFLATNDRALNDRISAVAYHFISQHHLAAVVSLAVTLLEMRDCGGAEYAQRVVRNTSRFAEGLSKSGIPVVATSQGFTNCHQTWVLPAAGVDPFKLAIGMYEMGLVVNLFKDLPGVDQPVFRMSMAEVTRCGATEADVDILVRVFSSLFSGAPHQREDLAAVQSTLSHPHYCFQRKDLERVGAPDGLLRLYDAIRGY